MFRFAAAALALTVAIASPAVAATELITNGNFSTYDMTSTDAHKTASGSTSYSQQMSEDGSYGAQHVSGWYNTPTSCTLSGCDLGGTTAGYNFIVTSASMAYTSGGIQTNDNGTLSLYKGSGQNTLVGSDSIGGSGGAFLAADGAYEQSLIFQTVQNLTVGKTYQLTFNYAGAQQSGYSGVTTEAWTAVFYDGGNNLQTYTTPTLTDQTQSFTGWHAASVLFTATSTTEILGFIAKGTPDGQPPFSLLDDVSLKQSAVPEPATWSMMIAGFGAMGVALRRKRKTLTLPA